jgi:hypothetical protein
LPARRKHAPPDDFTGHGRPYPSGADVTEWLDAGRFGNLALRLPPAALGLDVDAYRDKHGDRTLADREQQWGPLPPTWTTSSRPAPSGIRLYRVPTGLPWPGIAGPSIELITSGNRYAVVAPSIHPEGRPYQWRDPDGHTVDTIPSPDDLPDLPERWITGLCAGRGFAPGHEQTRAGPSGAEKHASHWREALRPGPACRYVTRRLDTFALEMPAAADRHGCALLFVGAMVAAGVQGHRGVDVALTTGEALFLRAVAGERGRHARAEWDRMLSGAVAKVGGDPTGAICFCDGGGRR